MVILSDPLFISVFLDVFMMSVGGCQSRVSVGWSIGVLTSLSTAPIAHGVPDVMYS